MKSKKILRILALLLSIITILMLVSCEEEEQKPTSAGEFVPPPFDAGAVVGVPNIENPAAIGYTELDAKAYKFALCGIVKLSGDSADIYLTNPETNTVWFKLRVLDTEGNILGETGLLRPGEYVKTITFDKKVPKVGDEIVMKIMGYEPDTYYSAGAVNVSTVIS